MNVPDTSNINLKSEKYKPTTSSRFVDTVKCINKLTGKPADNLLSIDNVSIWKLPNIYGSFHYLAKPMDDCSGYIFKSTFKIYDQQFFSFVNNFIKNNNEAYGKMKELKKKQTIDAL